MVSVYILIQNTMATNILQKRRFEENTDCKKEWSDCTLTLKGQVEDARMY